MTRQEILKRYKQELQVLRYQHKEGQLNKYWYACEKQEARERARNRYKCYEGQV